MGMFSWLAVDTDEQIFNDGTEAQTVTMVYKDREGIIRRVTETDYEGYGVFGGIDFYDAVCWMNGLGKDVVGEIRDLGIELWFSVKDHGVPNTFEWPQLYLLDAPEDDEVDFSIMCEDDPNQGWGECYEEDENEEGIE